jgi:hypothetical protein
MPRLGVSSDARRCCLSDQGLRSLCRIRLSAEAGRRECVPRMNAETKALRASGIDRRALYLGAVAPDFCDRHRGPVGA